MKTTIITALLLLAMVSAAVAQVKWEYAVLANFDRTKFTVTKHTTEFISIEKGSDPYGELIKKLEEMSKEGWEVYNAVPTFNQAGFINEHVYYLRKKGKE